MERFELAEALVRKAGAALRQARLEADAVSCKTGHQDLVTVWDKKTEQFLRLAPLFLGEDVTGRAEQIDITRY